MAADREQPTYANWRDMPVTATPDELIIGGWSVMQRWEQPLMERLAAEVTVGGDRDVLEVGFGMGISADAISARGCRSYTVIEPHPRIAAAAREWGERQPMPVAVVEGYWQEVVRDLPQAYDGILFDTYPLVPAERGRNHFPFIPHAARLLRPGGALTHFSDETTEFRPEHLTLLLTHFDEVKLVKVSGLKPPPDCGYWSSDTMIIPVATRRAG